MPRYALITGASSGIGLALAEALARRGRALILVARQRDALESIAYELAQRFGVEVLFRTCDLSEPLQLSGLLHELEQGERQIDLLVNNAGIGTSGPFIDQEWAREQELIELNILALARLCHSLGARMVAQGGGQILNIASVAAFQPVSLDLKVGDSIEIGRKPLRIARILTYEPDRAGDFYSLTPRAMMSLADLDATGVVQPGSRVRYRDLWEGPPEALQAYRQQVKGSLAANQRLQDARDGNRQVGDALGRAERYLNLASLAAVLLAGVAVALSAARFAARRYDASALLRCLGLSRSETLLLYALQLLLLGLLASAIGALLGWLAQLGLFRLLATLLPPDVPAGGLFPAFAGIATGLVALAGFALPPLAALGRVPPLRVLRSDLLPPAPRAAAAPVRGRGCAGPWRTARRIRRRIAPGRARAVPVRAADDAAPATRRRPGGTPGAGHHAVRPGVAGTCAADRGQWPAAAATAATGSSVRGAPAAGRRTSAGSASARCRPAPAPARPGWPGCAGPPRRGSARSGAGTGRGG